MKFSIADQKKKYATKEDIADVLKRIEDDIEELVEVDLSGNCFSEEAMEEICKVLTNARCLRVINLSSVFLLLGKERLCHNLALLSKMLRKHCIQKIDLSDNAIGSEFPEEFGMFISEARSLVHLKMNNCGLGEIGGNRLGRYMKSIEDKGKLEVVDIAQNRFFVFPKELLEALEEFDGIKELRIQYNTIEEVTMLSLLNGLEKHVLEVLDMRDNFLSEEGSKRLGELYCGWDMKELRVGDCMMRNSGVKRFLEEASKKFVPMCLPGEYTGRSGVVLDLSYNEFEQDAMDALCEFCRINAVKELIVFGNYYEDASKAIEVVNEHGGKVIASEGRDDASDADEIAESLIEKVAKL